MKKNFFPLLLIVGALAALAYLLWKRNEDAKAKDVLELDTRDESSAAALTATDTTGRETRPTTSTR